MKTQKLNIRVQDWDRLLGKSRKTMMEGRNLMKSTTLMMCFIAALSIFTLPVDAADQSIPITVSVPVVCNVGEVVDLSGILQTVITFTRNRRHGIARVDVNAQGITGTGEITGRTFQANGQINMSFRRALLNGASTVTTRAEFIEVTSAPGPDGSVIGFWLQGDVHVTFSANGAATVRFDNFTVDCSGNGAGLWDY
jgi:hypothetical protein